MEPVPHADVPVADDDNVTDHHNDEPYNNHDDDHDADDHHDHYDVVVERPAPAAETRAGADTCAEARAGARARPRLQGTCPRA